MVTKTSIMRFCSIKGIKAFLRCGLVFLPAWTVVGAQEPYCENLSFEMGDFTNWAGHTWYYSAEIPSINTEKVEGIVFRRHTIISDTTAYDPNTGGELKKVPPGYRYSARLGDGFISTDNAPRCWDQSLRYTMTIDSGNALLIIKFALVLQYAGDHTETEEPRFRFTLFDQKGDTIPDCSNYDVYASNSEVKGFHMYEPGGDEVPVQWRDWTTVGANLTDYIGQTITLEFMTCDCTRQFHCGYAYFMAECHPLHITVHYCAGDSVAVLTAPEGFKQYRWMDNNGNGIDSTQSLSVTDPVEGDIYTCAMTSVTGCKVSLQSVIARYVLSADFDSYMIDCNSNTVQLTNSSATTRGNLIYRWDFGDGNISAEKDPRYTFSTSGIHRIALILMNPPSTCVDTLIKDVESFSPPLVGIDGDTTYCPGLSVFLKAYGAYDYTWSNGSKEDSIEIRAPGGEFWLMGRSSTGCVSDTISISVNEEPDWEFHVEADTLFCEGGSSTLAAYGADRYTWNTGSTSDSINVTESGTYSVTVANKRGCEKSATFHAVEVPFPDADFTLSGNTLDSRHNQLTCNTSGQSGVQYHWDMGDGLFETGSLIHHAYDITAGIPAYTIRLTATNKEECTDSASLIIDVVPFVPNVFTPNGDGINDIFMAGYELEVFDRNGLSVYEGTDGWDGIYNGLPADADTYFYRIDYTDRNQQVHTRKGFVTLVR